MQSDGTLILPESSMTPQHKLVTACIGPIAVPIPELNLHVLGIGEDSPDLIAYRGALRDINSRTVAKNKQSQTPIVTRLRFLSQADGERLGLAEEEHTQARARQSRPQMLLEALRSLGRAAHYREIAEECNRLFPGRKTAVHSWHAALSLSESEVLGIVWIGRKGMYGLKEHGYSRPSTDLFDAAASIVETVFARTHRPVSDAVVMAELILSQKVCAGRIRTNVPTPGYNIQSLFRILPQHTVALRCAKSLELPQNGFLRGNQN